MIRKLNHRNVILWGLVIGLCSGPAAGSALPGDPNTPFRTEVLRREIKEEQIQPLFLSITSVTQTDLDSLISSLDKLTVPSDSAAGTVNASAASASAPAKIAPTPTQADLTDAAEAEAVEKTPAEPPADTAPLTPPSPEWLRKVDNATQPVDPLALADVLFSSGRPDRAERFYKLVIEKVNSPEDPNWQWAMYQRANCLRRKNQSEAIQLYQELVQKAPNSCWSNAASTQQTVLRWYESTEASQVKRLISDPNSLL